MITPEQITEHVQQWLDNVVIGLGLCPFAEQPVVDNRHRIVVLETASIEVVLEALGREFDHLAASDTLMLETSLLILPSFLPDFLDFNDFMSLANQFLSSNNWSGVFQLASFHPGYQFLGTASEAATNFTNRSPYPIVHILRERSVSWAVANYPDIDAIPERNMAIMNALSLEQITHLFPNIKLKTV